MAEQTQAKKYSKPLPHLDEENRPWWEALQRHELYIQKCREVRRPALLSARAMHQLHVVEYRMDASAAGAARSTPSPTTYQNQAPGFRESLPYIMAYVELDEGVKMLTNIVDCPPEQVKIGMPVEVVYEDVTPKVTLAKFRPAR